MTEKIKQIFPGVWKDGSLMTENSVPGIRVYGERLIKLDEKEFREWDPTRSKLAAAILNGLTQMPIKPGSKVLYLGASTGTTVSHVADIVGPNGIVYALEFSERVFRSLLQLAIRRQNIVPLLVDCRKPENYDWIEICDVLYCDLADPQETEIAIRNSEVFLKEGVLMLAIKSRSIDVTKQPEKVYEQEAAKLSAAGFTVLQQIDLAPYELDHAMIICKKLL
jgi:fibrillarin-like pre-rRNA processing protein